MIVLISIDLADCDRARLARNRHRPPPVEPAELRMAGEGKRRQLGALPDLRRPAVDQTRDHSGGKRVGSDLINAAELARLKLG